MSTEPAASMALTVLLYGSPVAVGAVFLSAKTVAACLLHQPSERSSARRRRYPVLALQILALATTIAEWLSIAVEVRHGSAPWPAQRHISYLVLETFIQASLTCGLLESARPLYYPYQSAWLAGFVLGVPLIVLRARLLLPGDDHAKSRIALQSLRVAIFLLLGLLTVCFTLVDGRRGIKLDVESEALLAANGNGHAPNGRPAGLKPGHASTENGGGDGDDDHSPHAESDSDEDGDDYEERERTKTKNEQAQRMKEAGSIWGYIKSFKVFVPLIVPMKDRLAQGCLAVIFAVVVAERILNILIPRQLGFIVDDLTLMAGTGVVPWRAIGLWALYTWLSSGTGLELLRNEAQLVVEQFAYKEIQTVSFRHIMGLSMDFHSGKNSGELIQAMSQAESLTDMLQYVLFEVLPLFFDLIVAVTVLARIFDVYMALVLFVSGSVYFWLGMRLTKWSLDARREFQAASRKEARMSSEALNNWSTVSHFNRADFEARRYGQQVDLFNRKQFWYFQTYYIGGGIQGFVLLAGRVLGTVLAAQRVAHGQASIGDFFFLQSYWARMEHPIDTLQWSIRRISSMMVDAERLLQVLTTAPSVASAPGAPQLVIDKGEVQFDRVGFAYDTRKSTLRDVDFAVEPGQTVALVGETGGGKSTVLKLLYRYYDVSEGAIRIDGQDIRAVSLDSLRDSFGMVPQDPSLFNVSIMDNLKYARLDATDEEVWQACTAACIHDKIMSFPDKYKSVVGERGMKLSGGEMQRIAIARAMLRQPKVIILDEATSMIDADTESHIQTALQRLTRGRTTFIIAHRLSTIQHADLILVVHDGAIVQRGTHTDLFRQPGKYKDLWSKQLSKETATLLPTDEGSPAAVTSEQSEPVAGAGANVDVRLVRAKDDDRPPQS